MGELNPVQVVALIAFVLLLMGCIAFIVNNINKNKGGE